MRLPSGLHTTSSNPVPTSVTVSTLHVANGGGVGGGDGGCDGGDNGDRVGGGGKGGGGVGEGEKGGGGMGGGGEGGADGGERTRTGVEMFEFV